MGNTKPDGGGHDVTLVTTPVLDEVPSRPVSDRVGRYQINGVLGAGAMGVVYLARDPELDRAVAIKLVRTDRAGSSAGTRMLREAQAMARLRHPNVVPIFDVGPSDGAVFVAMPLMEGGTLSSWLSSGTRSFDKILDRFVAAGCGLAAAHAAGVIHRDFKPENVLLGVDGETQVADFGLAYLNHEETAPIARASPPATDSLTQTGDVFGTPAYMAPEQLCGRRCDARADQFSFCVALWEGVYGERPFAIHVASTDDPIRARLDAVAAGPAIPAQRRGRPAWLGPVLTRGLHADPDRRWPTMQALLDAIAARRRPRRWPRRLAVGLAAFAIAVAVIALRQSTPPEAAPARLVQLTQRVDLRNAALSPDGTRLAIVAGDSLVIRGVDPGAEDRVLVAHGIDDASIAWSPDGQRLLVAIAPDVIGTIQTELVDVEHGVMYKLPAAGMAVFLSSSEVAVTSYRQRSIEILPLSERAATVARCDVPGDYTFLWSLQAMRDGSMIVRTQNGETGTLVLLARDCRVLATFSAVRLAGVAVTDIETAVALVQGDGFGEILEISRAGAILSRRRVIGEPSDIIGRRHGVDYLLTVARKTHLDRVHGTAAPTHEFSSTGATTFALAPDGHTLAWIELGGVSRPRGPLRLSTLQGLALRGRPLLDNAVMTSWSPDGASLATLVDDVGGVAVVVVDRASGATRRLPLQHLNETSQPVWLDDHRVAAQTYDRTTYLWLDLLTGEQGELVDRSHGSTSWLVRSPRDGTLAMWRNGKPGAVDTGAEHLWLIVPGHEAAFVHVAAAARYHLMPSWSSGGELLVQALETGAVSRVALDTGELTPVTQLAPISLTTGYADHLMTLPDGDLLATQTELGINVSLVRLE